MRATRTAIICTLLVASAPDPARCADNALIQLYGFRHYLEASYSFDSYRLDNNGRKTRTSRHSPLEKYQFDMDYALYDQALLRGAVRLGLEARQDYVLAERSQRSRQYRHTYDINGTWFRLLPHPISFYLGSSTVEVSPPFSRSYQLEVSQQGVNLALKNLRLPVTFYYDRFSDESSGQLEDRRNDLTSWGINLAQSTPSRTSTTTVGLVQRRGTMQFLDSPSPPQDNRSLSVTLSNVLQPWPGEEYARSLNSSLRWNAEEGIIPGRSLGWSESLDWELGKVLRLKVEGNLDRSRSAEQKRELRTGRGSLEHRLLDTVHTRLFVDASDTRLDNGAQSGSGGGVSVDYLRLLPRDSSLLLQYAHSRHGASSEIQSGAVLHRDERLNAAPIESGNYLSQNDIVASSVQVWNANRTRVYLRDFDYRVVADGRRTRLRIEPQSTITLGEPLSVDYSVAVNPNLKTDTVTRSAGGTLKLWQNYMLSASWNHTSTEKKSGSDLFAPVGSATGVGANFEYLQPTYRTGLLYSWSDSSTLKYRKYEGYWKYNREFERSALSAAVSDVLTSYQEARSGAVVSEGGTTNQFRATTMYRRQMSDKLRVSLSGQYEFSSGRATDQQLISGWLLGSFNAGRMVMDFSVRSDWRIYEKQDQQSVSARVNLKRYF